MMDMSKLREGTRCKCCKRKLESHEDSSRWYQTHTTKDPIAYVCPECMTVYAYGTNATKRLSEEKGKDTKNHLRQAIEVEFFFKPNDEHHTDTLAFLSANYHLVFSRDRTVDIEAHEQVTANVHGFKERWRGISEIVDLVSPGCGHHINLSTTEWAIKDLYPIVEHKQSLFMPLLHVLNSFPDDTKKFWGRNFTDYCESSMDLVHGDWLNIQNIFNDDPQARRIEFRLPKFHDENQFFYLVNFCRDTTLLIDKFLNNPTKDNAQKTGKKIVNLYYKYLRGEANCQRPERNRA